MRQDPEHEPTKLQQLVQRYLHLYSLQHWDEWIDLWTDDGVLEFPYAPAGRRCRYAGKADILAYMKAAASRMAGRIKVEGLDYFRMHPMLDPDTGCFEMAVKGRIVGTEAPYDQKYISIIETNDGRISLYREYWNPVVSIDASGGRAAWAAAFGSPEQDESAS